MRGIFLLNKRSFDDSECQQKPPSSPTFQTPIEFFLHKKNKTHKMYKKYTDEKCMTPADIFAALTSRLYCEHCHVKFVDTKSLLRHRMYYCYKRQKLSPSCTVTSEADAASVREELHENDASSDFQESDLESQPQEGQLEAEASHSDPPKADLNEDSPRTGPPDSDFIADSPNTITSDSLNEDSNSDCSNPDSSNPDSQNSLSSEAAENEDGKRFLDRLYRVEVLKLPLPSSRSSEPSSCADLKQKFEGVPDKEYARRAASRKSQSSMKMFRYACLERSTRFYRDEYTYEQVV